MNPWTSQNIVHLHDQDLEREAEAARLAAAAAHSSAAGDSRAGDGSAPVSLLRRLAHAVFGPRRPHANRH